MAIVPTTGGPTTLPRSAGPVYQNASGATPDAFGAAQGRALEQAGRQLDQAGNRVGDLALNMQREDNLKAVKDADTQFRTGLLTLQYGDGTPENPGYFGLRGEDATSKLKDYQDNVAKLRAAASAKLGNEAQQRDFSAAADNHTLDLSARMLRHAETQRVNSQLATSEARVNVAVAEASASFNDPQVLASALATARGEAVAQGKINGASPEVTTALIRKAETQVLSATILSAAETDISLASQLLKANVGRMDPAAALSVRRVVDKEVEQIEAQKAADVFFAKVTSGELNPEQARQALREQYEGSKETAAMKELDARINDRYRFEQYVRARRAEQRQDQADLVADTAERIAASEGTPDQRRAKLRQELSGDLLRRAMSQLDQRIAIQDREAKNARAERVNGLADEIRNGRPFDALSAAERSGLTAPEERNLREISRRTQLGIPNESEPGAMGEIFSMVEGKRVDELLAIPVDEMRTKLSDDDFKRYYSIRLGAAKGRLDPNVSSDAAFVLSRLRGYSQFQSASKKDDVNRLTEVILSEVNALRAEKRGGRITDAERLEIVNQAVKTYVTQGTGVFGQRTRAENEAVVADAQARGPRLATARAAAALKIAPDPKTLDAIRAVSIPTEERPQLIAAWRSAFGTAQTPSEVQLKALYWKANNSQ
jgi:hypothetical protein